MATHSSVLAWRIPGTGEPGGLPSMVSHRVGHDRSNLAAAAALTYIILQQDLFKWATVHGVTQNRICSEHAAQRASNSRKKNQGMKKA